MKERIQAFDYFRGIAILLVVAGHCVYFTIPDVEVSFFDKVLVNLIQGGTGLFVFISGFFFHFIFYKKFHYTTFIKKKLINIYVPFLVITTSLLILSLLTSGYIPGTEAGLELNKQIEKTISIYFVTGLVTAHWYIPFILVVFLLSPVFFKFINLKIRSQLIILGITSLLAMLTWRPEHNNNLFHSTIYFVPFYLIGIITSIYRLQVMKVIKGKWLLLFFLAFLTSILQVLLSNVSGNFHKAEIFSFVTLDYMFIQKIFLCFFFLSLLTLYENKQIKTLKSLADMSFGIFFIHGVVLMFANQTGLYSYLNMQGLAFSLMNFVVVLFLSVVIVKAVKLIFAQRSKYLIGW